MRVSPILIFCSAFLMASCSLLPPDSQDIEAKQKIIEEYTGPTEEAWFAGGCFWCIESAYEYVDGVVTAVSGFAGGEVMDPSYGDVSSGKTQHIESVLVIFDPTKVTYAQLVEYFWKQIDPTDAEGSFVDRGHQYTSAIFTLNEEQARIAEASKKALGESGRYDAPIVTDIRPAVGFYPAEDYHQDYYINNPIRYNYYRNGSGRDQYLLSVWGEDTSHGF
jgi:peptide methionine sulfoxide reductase msrA/msrB